MFQRKEGASLGKLGVPEQPQVTQGIKLSLEFKYDGRQHGERALRWRRFFDVETTGCCTRVNLLCCYVEVYS